MFVQLFSAFSVASLSSRSLSINMQLSLSAAARRAYSLLQILQIVAIFSYQCIVYITSHICYTCNSKFACTVTLFVDRHPCHKHWVFQLSSTECCIELSVTLYAFGFYIIFHQLFIFLSFKNQSISPLFNIDD